MKKSKVVIPALGLIALSTAASITGTVAWFSANQSVRVTGMQVKTHVSSNLLIAGDTLTATAKKQASDFNSGPLNQEIAAILMPVSTVNGTAFFYTTDAKADGDAKADVYTAFNPADNAASAATWADKFSENYGITTSDANTIFTGQTGAKPFVDYVFQVRAQNTEASSSKIAITRMDLIYGGAADASKAYRVAVFVENLSAEAAVSTGAPGTLKTIYTVSGAQNFDNTPKAVDSTTTLGAVSYNTANAYIDGNVASNSTVQYKVVVRLWLEGEDNTCNNTTFAALNQDWKLNLELKMANDAAQIGNIAKYTSASVSATKYFYDGTYVWTDETKLGTTDGRTAIASASSDVQEAFGYVAP